MARREWVDVHRRGMGEPLLQRARWCASFFARLRGLMFTRAIAPGQAIVLVEPRDSRAGVSIHMFFVPFTIAAVWIDSGGRVVDKVAARPWRPYYALRAPARYTLETHPEFLERVAIGDELVFDDVAAAPDLGSGRGAAALPEHL